jgi:hypothetical protein
MKDAVLLASIRLGWKGLPGANSLAYLVPSKVTNREKIHNIGPWYQYYNSISSSLKVGTNKLECMPIAGFRGLSNICQ